MNQIGRRLDKLETGGLGSCNLHAWIIGACAWEEVSSKQRQWWIEFCATAEEPPRRDRAGT